MDYVYYKLNNAMLIAKYKIGMFTKWVLSQLLGYDTIRNIKNLSLKLSLS